MSYKAKLQIENKDWKRIPQNSPNKKYAMDQMLNGKGLSYEQKPLLLTQQFHLKTA